MIQEEVCILSHDDDCESSYDRMESRLARGVSLLVLEISITA